MKRLLIEDGLPFEAINQASHREKSGNAPDHPRRLHLWWARRPLAMCRAIVLGSLIPAPTNPSERRQLFDAISDAALFKDAGNAIRIGRLQEIRKRSYPAERPKVLDCFAGGGAIPLEALRIGCDAVAVDLNPVAHLIERCMLEYPQRFGSPNSNGRNELSQDVHDWGLWVRERATKRLAALFPLSSEESVPLLWFWARTMPCPNPSCNLEVPLVRTWWLVPDQQRAWLRPFMAHGRIELELGSGDPGDFDPSIGTARAASMTCPICNASIGPRELRKWAKANQFGLRMTAVLELVNGSREYRLPRPADKTAADGARSLLAALEDDDLIPTEPIDPSEYRTFKSLVYGITRFRDLFTPRQLVVAGTLCALVREAHDEMLSQNIDLERARAVATYLGLIIDRIVDYNSAFTSWGVTREMTRNTFSRQAISMVWDFTEINPFADIPGNWDTGLRATCGAIERCADTGVNAATVFRGNAQALDWIEDGTFDAVIADPPYYDAVQYADLSDYFYVWLKRSIGELYPETFAAPLTPKSQEITESMADPKSAGYISSAEFEIRLARAIGEMRRVVKPEGVVTVVFAHTESDAWERLLRALLSAGLVVSTSWPMKSEMGSRSTANISAVLGSSVVLVCRPRTVERPGYYDEVLRELDERIAERLIEFEQLGLAGADYLISAIGPAFEVFGRYSSVRRLNDEEVAVPELLALARRTVAQQAMRRLLGSEGLALVDDQTLLYLTWRWAYGAARIPVDEAQKLGKAFHVEVDELGGVDGLAETSHDAYALRGPDERKKIRLGSVPAMIDVLHVACQLHEAGRRRELGELLAITGLADEPTYWSTARAIAESLPDGNRERTMLVNLLGGRDQVVAAAHNAKPDEAMTLFDETSG